MSFWPSVAWISWHCEWLASRCGFIVKKHCLAALRRNDIINFMGGSHLLLAKELLVVWPLVGRVIRQQVHKISEGALTTPQYRVLKYVDDGCTQVGRLAEKHGISQPSMSKMIEGLVKKGFLRKQVGKKDRRQVELKLSAKGKRLLLLLQKNIEAAVQEKIDRVPHSELETLCHSLNLIKTAFPLEVDLRNWP